MIELKETPESPETLNNLLHPIVRKWFFSKFKEFSLPQLFAVPEIHARQSVLVSAPTGATKTLTGFLSILNELVDSHEKGILENKIYCVYVSPLKALNYDIEHNLKTPLQEMEEIAGKKIAVRIAVRTGDTTQKEKAEMLKNPPHILITTPESVAILLSSIKFSRYLQNVEWCIVDEIHALADNKRGVHLSISIERLASQSNHLTRVGLSATVAPLEEIAKFLVGENGSCKIVDVQFIKKMDLKVLSPLPDMINTTFEKTHSALYHLLHQLIQEHHTTLIFTNTRSATERVVHNLKEMFPTLYHSNIGAHHGSLAKELRHNLEKRLREGLLKVVVCSTSLELGIDIGFVDLVVCLSSPKSVARALQRIGRSGHRLCDITKGRIIVLDRDDLVECSVLLKAAMDRKIDKIHIPKNCLDVLAQQIIGIALEKVWDERELFELIKKSYCYSNLAKKDFDETLSYLAGEFVSLEDRHVYAKIWRKDGKIGRRGRLGRVIYMTNIGTIPDETFVLVKIGDRVIGKIDENFLEKLKAKDIFLLGGETYEFQFSRGMVAQVKATSSRPPTVPSWFSEMLPLSFDLAEEIGRFRALMLEKFSDKMKKEDIIDFVNHYLYVDRNGAEAIWEYFQEQYEYCGLIPTSKRVLIEHYNGENEKKVIFHTLFGRRVNDCLSRAIGFVLSKQSAGNVEIGINDNGFYFASKKSMNIDRALSLLKADKLELLMSIAIDSSEVLRRRFRHCATRAFMILRNYKGRQKRVGRQQVSSMILMKALKNISPDFSVLKEARREVLEDLMDIGNTKIILERITNNEIQLKEFETKIPSPFAFNLVLQGAMDVLKAEDRIEFLKRMHNHVLAKISLKKARAEL